MTREKRALILNEMKGILVRGIDRNISLYQLCEEVGVSNIVHYWNNIEKKCPKEERSIMKPTKVVRVVHDFGFIFKDGFEIRHVEPKYTKLYKEVPVIEKRERKL